MGEKFRGFEGATEEREKGRCRKRGPERDVRRRNMK